MLDGVEVLVRVLGEVDATRVAGPASEETMVPSRIRALEAIVYLALRDLPVDRPELTARLFPEGTSTDGTQVRTFHGRLLGSATQAGVPLQPVAIRYLRGGRIDPLAPFIGDDELPGHLLRLLGAEVAEVQIHLLPPIDSRGRSRDDLARLSQQAVAEALGLRVPPSPPAPLPSRERGDGACRPA